MAACACNAASALWCATGENSPAACAWAACSAANVGSEAVVNDAAAAVAAATLAAVDAEEAETGRVVADGVVVTVALVCVLRWDMRSSLDENLLPHTSLPFIQLQTCAEEDGDETEVIGGAAGDVEEATVRGAAETEVGSNDGGSNGPEGGGGGGKRPGGYAKGGGLIPAAAAAAAA